MRLEHSFAIILRMDIKTYIQTTGTSLGDFSNGIGVSRNLAYQWAKGIRPVAARWCWAIETFTEGKVTRIELRPNDWRTLWPDLVATEKPPPRKSRKPPSVPN